jgi:hypothetical protein
MSTKRSSKKAQQPAVDHKSLVHVLEDCVLALESEGQTEQDIFSLVNMILRGFIRDGELTQEYIMLANKAIEFRQRGEAGEPITVLTDSSGNPLLK